MNRRAWERRLAVRLVRCGVPQPEAAFLLRATRRVGKRMIELTHQRPVVAGKVVRR